MKAMPVRFTRRQTRLRHICTWGAALALGSLLAAAQGALAAQEAAISLNAGETYTLTKLDTDSTPQVTYADGVRAFQVEAQGPGKLVLVALARGEGTLLVKRDGKKLLYHVTVSAIADPSHPLAPGVAPPAMSDAATPKAPAPRIASAAEPGGVATYYPSAKKIPASVPAPAEPVKTLPSVKPQAVKTASSTAAVVPLLPGQSHPAEAQPVKYKTNPPAVAAESSQTNVAGLPPDEILVRSGGARIFRFPNRVQRVSIANTKVADIQVVNPRELMLVGHKPGFTDLVVWTGDGSYVERQIRTEKTGPQQVLLSVVVAELNRSALEQQGIDYSVALTRYGFSLAGLPGMVADAYTSQSQFNTPQGSYQGFLPPGGNYYPLPVSSNLTYAVGGSNSNVSTNSFFQFLENHNLGKILAEPRLLANSGEKAQFLSGGEIPIIVSQALNTSIVFKQYGTSVSFVPTVVGRHTIELQVKPEVSEPDYTHQVDLNGYTVPAFVTRRADTRVRLQENQTLLIAGLLLDTNNAVVRKVPYLGDIPYIGGLFRNTYWNHNKTDLVMAVTPHIVRPIPAEGQLELPTDDYRPMSRQSIETRRLPLPDASRPRF